jgi:PUB domain
MNLETEVHVPLDDFVEYVQEQAILRLPETKMGIKLKSTLKPSKNPKIDELVEVMFKEVEGQVTATQSNSLDSIFTLLENILNYPYEDQFRVLDLENYPDNKVLNMQSTHDLLELIGFENGSLPTTWVYPHNKDLSCLLQALEALISKISLKIEVS